MAEFREVMKQWKRMCIVQTDNYGKCEKCPLGKEQICSFASDLRDDEIERLESTLMTWATEHPEPVYPTWGEWLHLTGLCEYENSADILEYHIPADIAKKLGIKPKEEQYES